MYVLMYVSVCVYIHTYIHTYIYIYIYMYPLTGVGSSFRVCPIGPLAILFYVLCVCVCVG